MSSTKKLAKKVMNVLSVFDGISCARVALELAGVKVSKYYASEIDKNALRISSLRYADIVHLGDVRDIKTLPDTLDLLVGGSPCTDLSIAKKNREGLDGSRSSLFWEFVRLWKDLKPKYFLLENVASMPKKDKDIITETLGVEPIMINAALVSAQCRKRLFWTNIPNVDLPADRGILLKDILQPDAEVDEAMVVGGKSYCLTATYHKTGEGQKEYEHNKIKKQRTMVFRKTAQTGLPQIRKLTPIECERLQGLPDNYTEGVAATHRYKCLGNAFNVDVVAHIFSFLP